ncbi:MAG TPA: nuclear transport factor 2 family protein, partial [Chloroflexota bacterium]
MLRIWLAMGVGVVFLMGSGVVATLARAQANGDAAAVITAYEMARNRRDVDAALSYFADDASVSVRNTLYSGKDEIRKYLDGPISRSRFVVVSDRRVSGSHVTWTERSGNQNATQPQAQGPNTPASGGGVNANAAVNVEAMVQEGKIRSLTYLV